jgi:LysR family nitrogen assimilation transcriptional regulator
MDLRQLRYFCAVVQHGHFGRAAAAVGLSQPALTRQVKLLEEELGVALLRRHRRGAAATPEGELLYERAQFALRHLAQARHDLTALRREASGPVSLGLSPALAAMLGAPVAMELARRWPGVRLNIVEDWAPRLQEMLLDGQLDLAILNGPVPRGGLRLVPALEEALCLVGPAEHPLLAGGAPLPVARLAGVPLILAGVPRAGVRLELESAAAREGVALDVRAEVGTFGVALGMVRAGLGLTVHMAAATVGAAGIAAVPLDGLWLRRWRAMATGRPRSRAVVETERVLRDVVARLLATPGAWPGARAP